MIAPEGKIILIPLLLLVIAGTGIQVYYPTEGLKWINLALSIFILFSLYFSLLFSIKIDSLIQEIGY